MGDSLEVIRVQYKGKKNFLIESGLEEQQLPNDVLSTVHMRDTKVPLLDYTAGCVQG